MDAAIGLIYLLGFIAVCFGIIYFTAKTAAKNGHGSFASYFILGIVLTPLGCLFLLLFVTRKKKIACPKCKTDNAFDAVSCQNCDLNFEKGAVN